MGKGEEENKIRLSALILQDPIRDPGGTKTRSVHRDGLAGLSIEYYLDESIGLGRYPMDIHLVYVCISQIEY